MRPRGFVELTFFRGDKILLVSPEEIVSAEPLTVTDGVVTMIRVQGEHGLRAVNGTLDEVAAAIDAAMRERRLAAGQCIYCGRVREDQRLKMCARCREKSARRWRARGTR